MFPTWDEETMAAILVSNDYHVERTIEQILSMAGEIDASDTTTAAAPSRAMAAPSAVPAPAPSSRSTRNASGTAAESRYRGIKTDLPEPFLRPPGWQQTSFIIADEELAMMLTNEQFQQQARELLGEDFFIDANGEPHQRTPQNQQSQQSQQSQQQAAQRSGGSGNQQQQQRRQSGMMDSISSMGAATKRNLMQLAARFSTQQQQEQQAGSAGGAAGATPQRSASRRGSREKSRFRSLDDEDTEVITFGSSGADRSHHVLNDDDEDEADAFDSENPLIQYNRDQQI